MILSAARGRLRPRSERSTINARPCERTVMMILRSVPPSPFARKCYLAASILGLLGQIKIEKADTNDADDTLRRQNPLGKIPTLVLEDGSTLFDSRVIV